MSRCNIIHLVLLLATGGYCFGDTNHSTSIIELIGNGKGHDQQTVRVIGYVSIGQEKNALYLHHDFSLLGLPENALWIDFPKAVDERTKMKLNNKYCLVEGVFNRSAKGHLGRYAGTITRISRVRVWCLPDGTKSVFFEAKYDSLGNAFSEHLPNSDGGF